MSLPSNWVLRSDSEEASLKRGGSADQSSYKQVWVVEYEGLSALEAHSRFSQELDGSSGVIEGKYGTYTFNFDGYTAKHLGNGYWEVEATYVTAGGGSQQGGDGGGGGEAPIGVIRSVTYNSTGSTQHITSGLDEVKFGANAPDMNKAIGVNGDNVEGVDVVVPMFEWTEEYEVPGVNLSMAYFAACAELTGTINQATFRGYGQGQVLFLGLTGGSTFNPNQSIASEVASTKLAFRFAAKKPRTLTVGTIAVTNRGWDYIWVRYADDVQNGIGLKVPVSAYANRVYHYGDFKKLRLPS